jgi:4-oxalocrotonate tautomerase
LVQFLNWQGDRRLGMYAPGANPGSSMFKEAYMPLVDIQLIKGVFTPDQKTAMIRKITDAMVSVEGEAMRPVTWVRVQEIESGEWAIGGNPLTASDVKAMAAAK